VFIGYVKTIRAVRWRVNHVSFNDSDSNHSQFFILLKLHNFNILYDYGLSRQEPGKSSTNISAFLLIYTAAICLKIYYRSLKSKSAKLLCIIDLKPLHAQIIALYHVDLQSSIILHLHHL